MAGNTFGNIFKLTTFGESHGPAIGGVIDGCPSGLIIDLNAIEKEMQRRKPGQSSIVTQRKEDDKVQILSGVFEGKTTGTPISLIIYNKDVRSKDYNDIKDKFRPGHADLAGVMKYGFDDIRNVLERSSARETTMRVALGTVCRKLLEDIGIFVGSHVTQIHHAKNTISYDPSISPVELNKKADASPVRCLDK